MKKILGLDLGTNSIGWAVVGTDEDNNPKEIINAGSRIIPMDAGAIGNFGKGQTDSQTAQRTQFRGVRRLRERELLRRERLHRVLNILDFLPKHYSNSIGWDKSSPKTYGKFLPETEPKLAWKKLENGKYEFLFKSSFEEMLCDFAIHQPQLIDDNKKVPYDWTIYFLRKKALSEKITKEELAWVILSFNQKRGYYQLRGEEEEEETKSIKVRQYFDKQIVKNIIDTGKKYKESKIFVVELEDGSKGKIFRKEMPQWIGVEKNIIATVDIDKDGNDKIDDDGLLSQRFKVPTDVEWETEWKLIKLKTEKDLIESKKTVGSYIYETLLNNPYQKVRGKLVRTIERKFYKDELLAILEKQKEFHYELQSIELYKSCIDELYAKNEAHKNNIANRDFTYLLMDDIIFYQRPLKSKKSLISDCPFETRSFISNDVSETNITQPLKCIAKSNPLYQEFRLWKFVANIKIYQREKEINGRLKTDVDVTDEFLKNEDDYVKLYEWLNDRKEIEQNLLLGSYFKIKKPKGKDSIYPYRWNYVEDKKYPCNETRNLILSRFEKANIDTSLVTNKLEKHLWHILYSVEDKNEIEKALNTFARKYNLNDDFVNAFKNCKPFKKEYGAFSEKAIKKFLSLMRMGKYWSEEAIDDSTKDRIDKIINGEFDEKIKIRVREKTINLSDISHFKALPEWLASYIIYDRFSEAKEIIKWETPEQLNKFIHNFKQHSLRNPIVEQVILETLRTVRDVWKKEGHIDEIHVELGRDMKNDKSERERLSKIITQNENTNSRIRFMLMEFQNPEYNIENVRPYSYSQQDILKIYEEYALGNLNSEDKEYEFINKVSKSSEPTKNDILRYRLWLEQKYRSPYTGEIIPLSKLFTTAYEIEHIIPKARFFDDSYSNKVICESEVNKLKDKQLGYEFIKNFSNSIIKINGKDVKIFSAEKYEEFIKQHYSNIRGKMKKLLMDDIPEQFIERQLNDTRYISKEIKRLLSNVVREKNENGEYEQEATSKHVISCTGVITSRLKQDWGLNDKWNELVLDRFIRLNEIKNTNEFTAKNSEGHEIPDVPIALKKGFTVKRIDHRHHTMDAIVIACTTRSHVNYLNNESAKDKNKRNALKNSLCDRVNIDDKGNYKYVFIKPWSNFPNDVKSILDGLIVSFKQNMRVINKNVNYYEKFNDLGKKVLVKQEIGKNWAIRKPMHKETFFGEVNLRKIKEVSFNIAVENPKTIVEKDLKKKIIELQALNIDNQRIKKYFEENKDIWSDINLSKIKVYYFTKETKDLFFATRKELGSAFKDDKGKFKAIDKVLKIINESITDSGIQKILLRHLESKENDPEIAFSPEGIEEMNSNIKELNNGKNHQPILKVRVYEKADKYPVGGKGDKKYKFVEAAKGTNLYFAVYQKEIYNKEEDTKEYVRNYETIPLNKAIERQKQGLLSAPSVNEDGDNLLFVLSPNDLVYVPTEYELINGIDKSNLDKDRIYRINDFHNKTIYFIPNTFAKAIAPKEIDTSFDSKTASVDGIQIKEICIPIKVDRLGNITI